MKITVDYREKTYGLIELLQKHFEVKLTTCSGGDYLINQRITVKKKRP